jgi:hypothetical protein
MKENDIDSFKHYKQQQMKSSTNKILEHLFGNKKKTATRKSLKKCAGNLIPKHLKGANQKEEGLQKTLE